jgi:hypothetical protein
MQGSLLSAISRSTAPSAISRSSNEAPNGAADTSSCSTGGYHHARPDKSVEPCGLVL